MDFSNFNSFIVPEKKDIDIVYVIGISNETDFHEFYVGQSSRHVGRFGDYLKPNFTAATDFKVGKAIEFLREKGFKIEIKYKVAKDRKLDEKELIKKIEPTLNDLDGYDYKSLKNNEVKRDEEIKKIKKHMQDWITGKNLG